MRWWVWVVLVGCTHTTPLKPYDISVTYRKCDDAGVCKVVTETLKEDK